MDDVYFGVRNSFMVQFGKGADGLNRSKSRNMSCDMDYYTYVQHKRTAHHKVNFMANTLNQIKQHKRKTCMYLKILKIVEIKSRGR